MGYLNYKKSTVKNKAIGLIIMLMGLWFFINYFLAPENSKIIIKSNLIYFLWISGYILPFTIFTTWFLVRSNKFDYQQRTRSSLLALSIMGIDLLIKKNGKIISDMNTNQITKEVNIQVSSIGYKPTIDYKTIQSVLEDHPTNIVRPKKDNRGRKN